MQPQSGMNDRGTYSTDFPRLNQRGSRKVLHDSGAKRSINPNKISVSDA
jgi:hypothetical protein